MKFSANEKERRGFTLKISRPCQYGCHMLLMLWIQAQSILRGCLDRVNVLRAATLQDKAVFVLSFPPSTSFFLSSTSLNTNFVLCRPHFCFYSMLSLLNISFLLFLCPTFFSSLPSKYKIIIICQPHIHMASPIGLSFSEDAQLSNHPQIWAAPDVATQARMEERE